MTVLDSIIQTSDTGLTGTDYTFIDADTLIDPGGNKYRIQGIDAPEVEKVVNGKYKLGTAGGQVATDTLRQLANEHGFTNVKPVLDENGEPVVDQFGRTLIDLADESGQSFKSRVLESGVLGTTRYTTAADTLTAELGQLRREQALLSGTATSTEWDNAREKMAAAAEAEGAKNYGFRQTAIDEAQLSAAKQMGFGHFYAADNVQVRDLDRSVHNDSLNPFTDSWEQGWTGVKEASFGVLNMLGETTGSEWLEDIGEAGVERARTDIADYGHILTDWRDVKGFDSAIQYVTNNAALSLPYMAISVGGAALAPFTFGASLTAPAAVYAGQTWNEMEGDNKNAAIAIGSGVAQAALDRLGLGYIVKTGVAPKKLLNEAVEELVKKGATREAAEQTVNQATRKELAGFVGDAATIARQQIQAKQIFKNLAGAGAIGAGGEAVTEALQEATGYTAAHWKEGFDFQELTDRALAGFIAGGTLGGAFSAPGSLYNAGAWADVAVRQAPAQVHRLSQAAKHAEYEEKTYGRVASLPELIAQTHTQMAKGTVSSSFDEKIQGHKESLKDRSFGDTVFDIFASAPSLWRGATRWIYSPDITDRSRSARILADMFGGGLQRTFSGASFENSKQHTIAVYKNMVDMPAQVYASFNNGKTTNARQRQEISNRIYGKLRSAINEDGVFDPDLIPNTDPEKAQLVALQKQLSSLGDRMWQDQKQFNPDLGYLDNYLLRYKSFDKTAIYRDKRGFIEALMDEFNMSESDAKDIADSIVDSENVNDFADILEGHQAAGRPGSHKQRTLNLSEKDRFQQYMNQDIFANISNAAKSAARYMAYQQYVGENNSVINQLLENARKEGLTDEQVNKIAKQMNDYLQAESGNYKRPTSEFGKRMETVQRNLMVWMTVAGLPLATISSFVEAALTMRGLTLTQIMGNDKKGSGGLAGFGYEFGSMLWRGMNEVSSVVDKRQRPPGATSGQKIIRDLGFYEWDVGTASLSSTATKVGATEISARKQKFLENYFKATGLQGWTNFTRSVRAAIVGDYINDKLELISTAPSVTNEVQEAREQLRNLGINVNDAVAAYNANEDINPDELREAMFTFINDAVALPQSANRPLIYQDPRFALFTQFQGFIATFTANHIPKLWGEYVKRGTPAMKYNAFATMVTMIMLGFASQYLKDLIKYGKTPAELGFGPDNHPYLSTSEYVQRGVRSSGLLGTGERLLDQFFPIYDKRTDGIGEWLWEGVAGESPALSFAGRAAGGVGKLAQGDVGGFAKEAVRTTPVGPINWIRNLAGDVGDQWNFNGE